MLYPLTRVIQTNYINLFYIIMLRLLNSLKIYGILGYIFWLQLRYALFINS